MMLWLDRNTQLESVVRLRRHRLHGLSSAQQRCDASRGL